MNIEKLLRMKSELDALILDRTSHEFVPYSPEVMADVNELFRRHSDPDLDARVARTMDRIAEEPEELRISAISHTLAAWIELEDEDPGWRERKGTIETLEEKLSQLWAKCVVDAGSFDYVPAIAVQNLILNTRKMMNDAGWPAFYQREFFVTLKDLLQKRTLGSPALRQIINCLEIEILEVGKI